MIIENCFEGIRYTLSNENLKEGDEVFPIGRGRCLEGGGWILNDLDYRDFMSGFPYDPHTILNMKYAEDKSYEVRTDHGYSPAESYYKIIKREEKVVVGKGFLGADRKEWREIK